MLVRIIPARAGFTLTCPHRGRCWTDHPRSRGVYASNRLMMTDSLGSSPPSRGVYYFVTIHEQPLSGSSPLARGLHVSLLQVALSQWIIPARAGFTNSPCLTNQTLWDHPRSRGVYAGAPCFGVFPGGSSPLARGLLVAGRPRVDPPRIIPARAGFTSRIGDFDLPAGDHPRSRGVYCRGRVCSPRSSGSSPLARGLRR